MLPGQFFSNRGAHSGASLKNGTGLLRWDLLMCVPGMGPSRAPSLHQHTDISALPPAPGMRHAQSCGVCPEVGMEPNLPTLRKPPTSGCIPPLPPTLPSPRGRVFPLQEITTAQAQHGCSQASWGRVGNCLPVFAVMDPRQMMTLRLPLHSCYMVAVVGLSQDGFNPSFSMSQHSQEQGKSHVQAGGSCVLPSAQSSPWLWGFWHSLVLQGAVPNPRSNSCPKQRRKLPSGASTGR